MDICVTDIARQGGGNGISPETSDFRFSRDLLPLSWLEREGLSRMSADPRSDLLSPDSRFQGARPGGAETLRDSLRWALA